MKRRIPLKFWIESITASVTAFLALLTLVWRDWIEGVFGFDPDHHNGSFEWMIVAGLFAASLAFSFLARRSWRRASLALD